MRICLSVSLPNLDSPIDPRFGRAPYFLITDERGEKVKVIKNTGVEAMGGAGITAAQLVVSAGAQVVITGNLGPRAFQVLQASGIKMISGVFELSAKEALEKYQKGELKEMSQSSVPGHFGMGRGIGGGRGRFRGDR
jgi:predicted Fe-Mo cluster-binding NifX family protein